MTVQSGKKESPTMRLMRALEDLYHDPVFGVGVLASPVMNLVFCVICAQGALPHLPGAVILAFVAASLFLLGFSRCRWTTRTLPQCNRCAYPVCGLPTDICPECGARISEVGTSTARTSRAAVGMLGGAVAAALTPAVYTAVRILTGAG